MRKSISILFFLVLVMFSSHLLAQSNSLYVKVITRDDGIASNRVNCIYEDKAGFIWFGSQQGLSRYAGDNIETYKNSLLDSLSLVNNEVISIVEETETGNLWIGTQDGLCYFNRTYGTFKRYFQNDEGSINSLCYDKENNLWIATGFGLFKYNKAGEFIQFKHDSDIPTSIISNSVTALSLDSLGNLWVGTDLGLDLLDTKTNTFSHHTKTQGLIDIISIFSAENNDVWIGTNFNGLFQMKMGTFLSSPLKHYNKENGYLLNDRVFAISEDQNNNLYIADRDGGLICINLESDIVSKYVADIYNPNSLNSNALRTLTISSDGIIWIGTYNSGVNVVDINRKPFEHYKINYREDGLFNNNVRSMFEDMEGNIWIGTKDKGGLSKFNREKGTFTHYKPNPDNPKGLQGDYIFHINEIDSNHLIIATYQNGIVTFDKKNEVFTHYRYDPGNPKSISSNTVYNIYKDLKGTIWIMNFDNSGKKGFLHIFDPKTGEFTLFDDIQNIRTMCNDDEENLWLGSYSDGLYLYNIETQKLSSFNIMCKDSICLANNHITSLKKDRDGNLWVGSDGGGLAMIENHSRNCKIYRDSSGLPNNRVLGIEIDGSNNIWVSTGHGIAKFNPTTEEVIAFDKNDGLQGNEFETYVSLKTKKGEMLFGGRNGFNVFDPDKIKLNENIPKIVFTGLKLFYKPVVIGVEGSPLTNHISKTETLVLNHEQSVFTFEFIALNYSSIDKNQYAYLMEGYDDDWIDIGNKHEATYANLPAGNYTFIVKASNNDGVWNEEGSSIKVVILAPWWETLWFRISAILFIVIAVTYGFVRRTQAMRRNQKKLEQEVKQATDDVKQRNEKLEEAKTKLALIMDDVKNQLGSTSDQLLEANTSQATSIEEISNSIKKMANEIDENATGASKMFENAQIIDEEAELSVGIVKETVQSIEEIAEEIGFISEFARMTNILAINAAIEAARAGEEGKSFAIVASQVKDLADQSQKVAVNIKVLSTSGLDLSKNASDKINELQGYIRSIVTLISQISQSSQNQSTVANQITSAVQEVSTHVNTTTQLAEKLDEAIKSLNIEE